MFHTQVSSATAAWQHGKTSSNYLQLHNAFKKSFTPAHNVIRQQDFGFHKTFSHFNILTDNLQDSNNKPAAVRRLLCQTVGSKTVQFFSKPHTNHKELNQTIHNTMWHLYIHLSKLHKANKHKYDCSAVSSFRNLAIIITKNQHVYRLHYVNRLN